MALPQILIDSGFLYALFDRRNSKHVAARTVLTNVPAQYTIPYVVLTETAFLFQRSGGVPASLQFLDALVASQLPFEPVITSDLIRAREIMATYPRARLDFVDCCLMSLSERLNITQICTFDQRDFSIFRPRHCDHLELLP